MSYTYPYPMAALTADCVVFGVGTEKLHVALIERGEDPFKGQWALPGGFLQLPNEDAETAGKRELKEEFGISVNMIEQLKTYSRPGRDPRGSVVTVAHIALVNTIDHPETAGSDAAKARWVPVDEVATLELAFDHQEIFNDALARLYAKLRYTPIAVHLLTKEFTLEQLKGVYEKILGAEVDSSNFRKAWMSAEILTPLSKWVNKSGTGPKPQLYTYDPENYAKLRDKGKEFSALWGIKKRP